MLAALATGAWFWTRLQPRFATDVRRDLLLDGARVTLLRGFDGCERLETWVDVSARPELDPVNPDRAETALLVRRASALRWDLGSDRPGRLSLGVARWTIGPDADEAPCELVVRAGVQEVVLVLAPAAADPAATPGFEREGPALPLHLDLPQGAASLELELRTPGGTGAGYAVLLSPRVTQAPLPMEVRELRPAVAHETRLLPRLGTQGELRLFARRRADPSVNADTEPERAAAAAAASPPEDALLHPVELTGAFPAASRAAWPALAFTGAARTAITLDLPAGARLRGSLALDARLPAGASAALAVAVDGRPAGRVPVTSARWHAFELDLSAFAGARRRLDLALEEPQLTAGEALVKEPDFAFERGWNVLALYEAREVRVGLADPRLVVERPVARRVASRERPSVLLLQVETLRADALAPFAGTDGQDFGAPADLAPNLARLAQRATRWARAMAPSPWTVPTSASLLTGLPPSAHGATRHERMALPGDVATLAEVCAGAGLATGAVVASDLLSEPMGFARGFQSFAHVPYANARQVHDLAESFLANHAGQQFFLFLHEFDPHSPYAAPEPWRDKYVEPGLRGRTVAQAEGRLLDKLKAAYAGGPAPAPDDPDLRWLRQRYLGEIAWWDSQLGALLDTLERLGLEGTTLVVITSDHGEEFLEHGLFGHGSNLFDETLHVPLLVAPPPGWRVALPAGGVAQEVVGTDALFASVLEWAGVGFDGEGVRPPLHRPQGFAFSETDKGLALDGGDPFRRALDSVRTDALRAIVAWPLPGAADETRTEVFDLRADPGARAPLAPGSPADRAFGLIRDAAAWCEQHRATAAPEGMSAGQLERLRTIGYIGDRPAPAPPAPPPEAPPDDPRH